VRQGPADLRERESRSQVGRRQRDHLPAEEGRLRSGRDHAGRGDLIGLEVTVLLYDGGQQPVVGSDVDVGALGALDALPGSRPLAAGATHGSLAYPKRDRAGRGPRGRVGGGGKYGTLREESREVDDQARALLDVEGRHGMADVDDDDVGADAEHQALTDPDRIIESAQVAHERDHRSLPWRARRLAFLHGSTPRLKY